MASHYCRTACKRFGRHRNGLQRFRCNQCGKTFTEDHETPIDEMRLPFLQSPSQFEGHSRYGKRNYKPRVGNRRSAVNLTRYHDPHRRGD